MTSQTRTVIKANFEQGDTPQGSQYSDWIDSSLFLADTTVQALSSPLTIAGSLGVSATVSASDLEVLGVIRVSGDATFNSEMTVSGKATFSTDVAVSGKVSAGSLNVLGAVSADTLWVGGQPVLAAGQGAALEIFVTAFATVTCSAADTWVTLHNNTSALSTLLVEFEHSAAAGAGVYTGANNKEIMFSCDISCVPLTGTNQDYRFALLQNGSAQTRTTQKRRFANTTDMGSVGIGGLLSMANGDSIALGVRCSGATANLLVRHVNLRGMQT